MEKESKKTITDQEMFDALSNAEKLYQKYLKIQSANLTPINDVIQESYMRDFDYPLDIVWEG